MPCSVLVTKISSVTTGFTKTATLFDSLYWFSLVQVVVASRVCKDLRTYKAWAHIAIAQYIKSCASNPLTATGPNAEHHGISWNISIHTTWLNDWVHATDAYFESRGSEPGGSGLWTAGRSGDKWATKHHAILHRGYWMQGAFTMTSVGLCSGFCGCSLTTANVASLHSRSAKRELLWPFQLISASHHKNLQCTALPHVGVNTMQ